MTDAAGGPAALPEAKPAKHSGTVWIFVALGLGVLLGGTFPQDEYPQAYELFHFLSKAFIALIKGLIMPLLVATIIVGIAQTGDAKAVGRMGVKSLIYFEVVTTLAMFIGLLVGNTLKPGAGLPLAKEAASGLALAKAQTGWDIALHMFPSNVIKHAADGDVLPVVIFSTLFGISLTHAGPRGAPVLAFCEGVAQTMFKYTDLVMKLTPLGVFGAMAYNVSHMAAGQTVNGVAVRGWPAVGHLLAQYAKLVGSLYLSLGLMLVLVFLPILLLTRVPVLGFINAVRDPAMTAFSTASSEAALPRLLERLVTFGVPRRVASFVVPTGYSFNLDGSTLYLVLASLSIAQAAGVEMSITQQITMIITFTLTSKGIAAVPRASLVIIAGTCGAFGLPGEAGVAMLLAVDEVMDMARTGLNVVGNGLASVVIARWEGNFGSELPGAAATNPEATAARSDLPQS